MIASPDMLWYLRMNMGGLSPDLIYLLGNSSGDFIVAKDLRDLNQSPIYSSVRTNLHVPSWSYALGIRFG